MQLDLDDPASYSSELNSSGQNNFVCQSIDQLKQNSGHATFWLLFFPIISDYKKSLSKLSIFHHTWFQ